MSRTLVVLTVLASMGAAVTAAAPTVAQAQRDPVPTRIAFAGTGHRSVGAVDNPVPDRLDPTRPLFGAGAAHYDDDVSARGELVVFTSRRDSPRPQVYLAEPDGTVRRLTTERDAARPVLSPDLRTVVFDSVEGGQRDLWAVGVDGTGERRLTRTPQDETSPTFSPDGDDIAFARSGRILALPLAGGPTRVLVNEPNGQASQPSWNPRDGRLAYTVDLGAAGTRVNILSGGATTGTPLLSGGQAGWSVQSPEWKPDGVNLLFLTKDQDCTCTADPAVLKVYCVDTSTLPAPQLPDLLLAEDRAVSSPTWQVIGGAQRLLVARTSAPSANTATLQDIQPDGTDPRDLGVPVLREDPEAVNDPNLLFHPRPPYDPWTQRQSYSPDGRRIVLSRFEDEAGRRVQRLWLVDADGANPRRVPVADRQPTDWEFDPAWSPDGESIVFARRSPGDVRPNGGPSRVVVIDADSGAVRGQLRPPPEVADQEDTQPAWSPDGRTLSFTRGLVTDGPTGEVRDNHIWTARADTLGGQRDLSAAVCGFDCAVTDDSPAFSPDSRVLAFNRENDGVLLVSLADADCRVVLPAGSPSCATPVNSATGPFQPRDVAFSAEGDRLVLTTRREGDARSPEALAVLDLDTGELARLDWDLPGRQKEPTWQLPVDLAVLAPPRITGTVGEPVEVPVDVVNHGPADTPSATVTGSVPEGLRLDDLRVPRERCDVVERRCEFGALPADTTVRVTAVFTPVVVGRWTVQWSVTGPILDSTPGDNASSTVVEVGSPEPPAPPPPPPPAGPALSVTVNPNPSYVDGRATVTYTARNGGPSLATGLRLDIVLPAGIPVSSLPSGCTATGCALPDLWPGMAAVVQVVLAPKAPVTTEVRGLLRTTGTDNDLADNTAVAPMRVLLPKIVALPDIGEPRFVTSVRGVDFPPGVPVALTWTSGITAAAAPTLPGADGRFISQLLILAKDQTGPRTITATGAGFRPATTPFLVVPGSISPPDMVGRR
ncbi:hypothetical protein [Actinokineospora globicatena]|uniref:hypothetical protein n=1 Tax=Actinokineospora globicatena TaxID=103729 RepID=UPI0020A30ED0|nr:hypothetical protein [Actinokineospora globicatena]MCP2303497.1 WD40-like Beta Propeller Repeat [Actinokineospora globicatena]GLW79369.1 hypothetical protein Aglo01_38510 [Actinokineospora globicatena]GLW86221.1 hypothetical protein Aglo02_38600 [Actinokineospora globicatena]